ncbi:MAG: peptide ABC transporter substrate-binding protein [Patescibacteria group bacterium]
MEDTPQKNWREELTRARSFRFISSLEGRVRVLSSGDRALFFFLALIVVGAALGGLYTLEQKLLIEVPTYGGSLTEGAVGSPQFMNPLLAISDADRDLSMLTYAGLMGLSANGVLIPVIAERYEISPDGKTYLFTIRADARFSDGTPITAEDVVFTIHKAQDPSLKSPEYANWSGVAVVALDERTVRLSLSKPYAPFLGLTTLGILPERLWEKIASSEFPFTGLETKPVGAGPFKVARVTRDASGLIKYVELSANPYYPLGRPYLDEIHLYFYPRTEDLSTALHTGAIESAYDAPSPSALSAPYARVFGVFWNPSEKPAYARLEVRKALSLALDRNALVNNVLGGYATAIMGPVPRGGNVVQASLPESANPTAAAAKVLTSAGWTYDGTERLWKNTSLKQTLDDITIRTSNVPELKGVASAVKTDWEKLGVRVTIELYEPGDLSQNVIRPRKYEALLYGMVIGRDQDLYAFWDSQERNDPGLNIALYANKEVDTLLEDARSSTDETIRKGNLQKVEDIVAGEYAAAFLYTPDFTYTIPTDIRGVSLPQIISPADRYATVAQWYRVTDRVWPFFVDS